MTSIENVSVLGRIALSVGATEPALRLLLSIIVGKLQCVNNSISDNKNKILSQVTLKVVVKVVNSGHRSGGNKLENKQQPAIKLSLSSLQITYSIFILFFTTTDHRQ